MARKDIVVIGTSAGGLEALRELAGALPRDIDASIFIVWHMPADFTTILPELLTREGPFPAAHPVDREAIVPRRIYLAPPDRHMLIEPGHLRVARGPRENRFRPAVDPLFRSAAYVYGSRVIGVVLTGALDDGSAGLWTIKLRGGTAMVQSPDEALHPSMPRNALESVKVDYTATLQGIAALLGKLTREEALPPPEFPMDQLRKIEKEISIAKGQDLAPTGALDEGALSPYTCPECHGVLATMQEGRIVRFRCHTGHAFTADSLLASLGEQAEARLWDALRAIDETAMLLEQMGKQLQESGTGGAAREYYARAKDALARAQPLRHALERQEPLSADIIEAARRP
jgi:two-component system chemotaxis response regulator CheB